ncbi:MAG: thiamine pyrophosphate-binding protein, partial [Candidatus Micrarchaeia archaeon]
MQMNGARAVVECLKAERADTVFGYPGGMIMHVFDEIFQDDGVRNILTRHEQGAAHAAEGYAKASGRPGVCISTSGPGATNL